MPVLCVTVLVRAAQEALGLSCSLSEHMSSRRPRDTQGSKANTYLEMDR